MDRVGPTAHRLLSSVHRLAQKKPSSLPRVPLLPKPGGPQWISPQYENAFFNQLSLIMEKQQRDAQNRTTKGYPTLECNCDAPAVVSPQMGSFRSWQELRVFFEGTYNLKASELKVLRVFECPPPEQLQELGVSGEPLLGVDPSGIPCGYQEITFQDNATLYVLAEQTQHLPSCLYRIQVKAIVETHVVGPNISDHYFTL
jgi:hypothetical protein